MNLGGCLFSRHLWGCGQRSTAAFSTPVKRLSSGSERMT